MTVNGRRSVVDTPFEKILTPHYGERRLAFGRRHLSSDPPKLRGRQRLRVVVVDIQAEHACSRVFAFEMVPVIGRHEKLAAVLWIVVPVRAGRVRDLCGPPVVA